MSCYSSVSTPCRRQLILFGRYPVPGRTKTRLIPLLGALGAAEWHRSQSERTLDAVLENHGVYSVAFSYTGAGRDRVRRWLDRKSLRLIPQKGAGLGERMRTAMFDALDRGCHRVVLAGTDIPGMTADHVEAAFDALEYNDLVLGPSQDGGYWMIGLRQKIDLFQGIAWGGAEVLGQTLTAARRWGLKTACLPALNDIDTPSDLKADQSWNGWSGPYLSVVIPALNEAGSIGRVIRHARSPECEIIVADGGSWDKTVEVARDSGACVLSAKPGRAQQQNAGAAAAQGRVLLFLHADTLLPPDYPFQVFETLMDRRNVAGAFQFKTDYDNASMRLIEKAAHIRAYLLQMPYGDQGLFMARTIFERIGGFPAVPIAEDLHLVRRLGRTGRIGMAPGVALTSGRRWRDIGVWRTTGINYLIAAGCLLGVDPHKLASLYLSGVKNRSAKDVKTTKGCR